MDPDEIVTLRSYDSRMEADSDQALLESEGIPVQPVGLYFRKLDPLELRVLARDAPRAAEILRSIGRDVPNW